MSLEKESLVKPHSLLHHQLKYSSLSHIMTHVTKLKHHKNITFKTSQNRWIVRWFCNTTYTYIETLQTFFITEIRSTRIFALNLKVRTIDERRTTFVIEIYSLNSILQQKILWGLLELTTTNVCSSILQKKKFLCLL